MSNPAHTTNAPDAGQGVEGSDHSPNLQEGTTVMTRMHHTTHNPHPASATLLPSPAGGHDGAVLLLPVGAWSPEHDEPVPFALNDPTPPATLAPVIDLDAYRARRLGTTGQVAA